jgi:hypothetical protein
LYAQGYKDAKLVDFNLALTNPSTIFEEERVRILGEKLSTARDMMDAKMFSKTWIYNTIFGLSEDEVSGIRENFVDDAKEYYRLETIQNEGTDPADPNAEPEEGDSMDDSWGFGDFNGMSEDEKQEAIKQRKKEEKKRRNAGKTYDHPDNKPMGRDPLGAAERRVSGRDWGDNPLKLEADFNKLDEFLSSKKSKVSLPTDPSLIVENTEGVVKTKKNDTSGKETAKKTSKADGYMNEDNLIDK